MVDIANIADVMQAVLGRAVEEWIGVVRVRVPDTYSPGQIIDIETSDNITFTYELPPDLTPGSEILVSKPPEVLGTVLEKSEKIYAGEVFNLFLKL